MAFVLLGFILAVALAAEKPTSCTETDVVIVGAGLSGLNQMRQLRDAGFKVEVLERGSDIGGTWFWNKYPGARVDVRNVDYYLHYEEINKAWNFTEEFSGQPELLKYIDTMDKVYNLRAGIHLNHEVTSAIWDAGSKTWTVTARDLVSQYLNPCFKTQFLILATGCLSAPNRPAFPGFSDFNGDIYFSSSWPDQTPDFSGKRVGLMGTGSTGVQMIPHIAAQSQHLTVFQRTPNYVLPLRNKPATEHLSQSEKEARRLQTWASPFAWPLYRTPGLFSEMGKEKFLELFEEHYNNIGGFDFLSIALDFPLNPELDNAVQDFIRGKIREIVKDPVTAEKLCPKYGYVCKRPLLGTNYFETYNRPNVELVSLTENPIDKFTSDGVVTNDGVEHKLDAMIFATGFDALVGAVNRIHIVGEGGKVLKEKYDEYVKSYLGLATAGFPNMFLVATFQSPSVFTNMAVAIEQHTTWITNLLKSMKEKNQKTIEATQEAEDGWVEHADQIAKMVLWTRDECKSWYIGSNIEGKRRQFLPYAGGFPAYDQACQGSASAGYTGFSIDRNLGAPLQTEL